MDSAASKVQTVSSLVCATIALKHSKVDRRGIVFMLPFPRSHSPPLFLSQAFPSETPGLHSRCPDDHASNIKRHYFLCLQSRQYFADVCVKDHRMGMMARFTVALVLLLSYVSAAQAVIVYNYNQCGGTGGLCAATSSSLPLTGPALSVPHPHGAC